MKNNNACFVCVNCGNPVRELFKKLTASVKTINCVSTEM